MLLDGKLIPDNRADIARRLSDHISEQKTSDRYEDELFKIKYFQKGTGNIVFKRLDLVEKMNDIIAKNYPSMLARR